MEEERLNACHNGKFKEMKELLRNNPQVAKNIYGWTPFGLACSRQKKKLRKLFLNDERVDGHFSVFTFSNCKIFWL